MFEISETQRRWLDLRDTLPPSRVQQVMSKTFPVAIEGGSPPVVTVLCSETKWVNDGHIRAVVRALLNYAAGARVDVKLTCVETAEVPFDPLVELALRAGGVITEVRQEVNATQLPLFETI